MKRIAVVEDELYMREELCSLLRKAGYEALEITVFEDAAEQMTALAPDLVLLDINLPEISGFQICRDLKQKTAIPVLVLTSRDQMQDELQALRLGADEYLTKPCRGERLLARITNLLKHKVNLPPRKRSVGYLFQSYALFPNMTVFQNIEAGIQGKKAAKRERAMEMMEKFHLSELASGYPARLSGGQQQRVALARILACEPELLLLDEPFSALDSYLKEELQFELKQHLREFGKTTIIVSHDRDEIYKLCDRTMVMGQGEILVSKDTKELFEQPERVIAARLTGCKNISRAKKCGMHKVYAMDWGVELTVDRKVSEKITPDFRFFFSFSI